MRLRVLSLNLALFILISLSSTAHAFTITRVSGSVLYRDGGASLVGAYEGYRLTNNDGVAHSDVWVASEGFAGGASIHLASTEDGVQHIGPMAAGETKLAFFYLISDAAVTVAQNHTIRAYIPGSPSTTLASQAFSFTAEETIQANANKVTVVTHTPSGPGVGGTLEITVKGATGTIGGSQLLSFTPASATSWRADAFQLETTTITFTGGNAITITDQLAFNLANSGDSDYTAKFTFRIVGVTATTTPVRPIGFIESGSQIKHTSVGTNEYQAIPPAPIPVNRLTLSRSPTVTELAVGGGTVDITMRVDSTDSNPTTLDKFVETTVSGSPSYVSGSSKINGVTTADPVISGSTWTWSGSLSIPASGAIELTYQASYAASSGTHVQSGAAFVGPTQIDSTLTTTDDASPDLTVFVGSAPDSDSDGLSDAKELLLGSDPQDNDTDDDGVLDGAELGGDGVYNAGTDSDPRDADTDDDGLSDGVERNGSGPLAGFGTTDPLDYDSDNDGLSDALEVGVSSLVASGTSGGTGVAFGGTNTGAGHYVADSEPSSTTDPNDDDSDDDGLSDGEEDQNGDGAAVYTLGGSGTSGSGETDPNEDDTDGDGLEDGHEIDASGPLAGLAPTDPLDADTDDGGVSDGDEVLTDSTDPNQPSDDVFCGTGYVNAGETCDDANTTPGDGCSATCTIETGYQCSGTPSACTPICGNGALHGSEACDDGDTDSGDGCSSTCTVETGYQCNGAPSACTPICGNGALHGSESCDDGDTDSGDGCSNMCATETGYACSGSPSSCAPVCGNGALHGGEACDDGDLDSGDGCSTTCAVETGYQCSGQPSACTTICGNGAIHGGETCDDGDADSGDGCSSACAVEAGYTCNGQPSVCTPNCGDGAIRGGEACDDGDTDSGDGCSSSCTIETGYQCSGQPSSCATICGDGAIHGAETCDDGDADNGDGCSSSCTIEAGYGCSGQPSVCAPNCGDGIVSPGEACDDGDTDSGDGCSSSCGVEHGFDCSLTSPSVCQSTCGDGEIASNEACDDGDADAADGCSATCTVESGWSCTGEPSSCATGCGDGTKTGSEACDDGNTTDGDGCSATCAVENTDRDGDGIQDALDDCPDVANADQADLDKDGRGDVCDADDDGDGLSDADETGRGSDPKLRDTDGDGLDDGQEVQLGTNPTDADCDDDGVLDGREPGYDQDDDEDGSIGALDPDSDNDGLFDGTELGLLLSDLGDATDLAAGNFVEDADPSTHTDPRKADTDGGGECDGDRAIAGVCSAGEDLNANGAVDAGEGDPALGTDDAEAEPVDDDRDGDGLTNDEEIDLGTDPDNPDTDGDGLDDGREQHDLTTNPTLADTDGDGLDDGREVDELHTNPAKRDTDGDGVDDGREVKKAHTDPRQPPEPVHIQGGARFGCQASGAHPASGGAWVVGLLLLGLGVLRRRRALQAACLAACALAPQLARADGFDLQRFKPTPNQQDNLFSVSSSDTLGSGSWELGLVPHYANDPLVAVDANGDRVASLVADQVGANVLAAIGILDRWEIGIDLPLSWLRSGESTVIDASDGEFGVGDLHVSTKLALLARERVPRPRGFGFGVLLDAYVPTGQDDRLQGEGFRFEPALVMDYAFQAGPRIGLQAGYRVRPSVELGDSTLDDAVALGAGIDVPVDADRHVHALAEISGDIGVMKSDWSNASYPIEALLGARYLSTGGLMLQSAFGMGVNGGVGAPDYRVILGASYRARTRPKPEPEPVYEVEEPKDKDGDGILDRSDQCPEQPEDQDGFEDADGCKDPDDDADGVLDEHDACPREAEDRDGFEDDNGCPDPDNDADGLLDADDKCPQEPETKNGFADTDGCPDEAPTQAHITCDRITIDETVLFETGSDRIDARSFGLLDQVAMILSATPDVTRLRVEGHTDNVGRKKANLDLSRRRAAAVRSYLVEQQVGGERLESEGYGDTKPIAPNKTKTGRAQNRRVDFIVVERSGACSEVK